MEKLLFQNRNFWEENSSQLLIKRYIFNFLNLHDLFFFNNEPLFRKSVLSKKNINFIDGFVPSLFLSLSNMRIIKRLSGPPFTKDFLENKKLSDKKKHFFIGLEKKDLDVLSKKFQYLDKNKIFCYNPPYIKSFKFSAKEILKISHLINSKQVDYVWVCVGSPKQNILSNDLYEKTKAKCFFNVGAALDFILGKKKRAPQLVRSLGIEWFYRLITDFKYSKKKVWRSFLSLRYLFGGIELK